MFNSKKTKENLEKAQELKNDYDSFLQTVKEMKTVSDVSFAALETGNSYIEKGIEDLTDTVQEQNTAWGRLNDKAAAVYSKTEKVASSAKKRQEGENSLKNCLEKVKKAAGFTEDIKTRCGQLQELEEKSSANWEKQFEDNRLQIEKMQKAANNMTVHALNTAVEAGKLGGVGKQFLQSIEEVRQLSEEYAQMLSVLSSQVQEFQEFGNREKELRQVIITGLLKKVESTGEWQEDIASLKLDVQEDSALTQLLRDQKDDTKAVADGIREACESFEDILYKLEEMGKSNSGNRQAKAELSGQYEKVYEKVLN